MSGKGDTPRPKSVPEATFADNYARTFGDPREAMRREHLAHAARVIHDNRSTPLQNATPCHDWPTRDTLPTTDPED